MGFGIATPTTSEYIFALSYVNMAYVFKRIFLVLLKFCIVKLMEIHFCHNENFIFYVYFKRSNFLKNMLNNINQTRNRNGIVVIFFGKTSEN